MLPEGQARRRLRLRNISDEKARILLDQAYHSTDEAERVAAMSVLNEVLGMGGMGTKVNPFRAAIRDAVQ